MMTRNKHSIKLFCSYSHVDRDLKKQLEINLGKVHISMWNDREIKAGENWKEEINEHLEEADIVLLLVSPDFKASEYCTGIEMQRALERQEEKRAYVIPVNIKPIYWPDAPFKNLHMPTETPSKAVTLWPNQDQAFVEIAMDIHRTMGLVLKKQYVQDALEYMAADLYQEAFLAYSQAFHHAPKDISLCTEICNILIKLGRREDALEMYEQAIGLEPENDRLYQEKGKLLVQLGRQEDALVAYQQAVALKTNNFALYQEMGEILYFLGKLEGALQAYQKALGLQPNDYHLSILKGNILFNMSKYSEALEAYEEAEKVANRLKKEDDQIYRNKGRTLLALNRGREALDVYTLAIFLKPNDPAVYAEIGLVYDELEEYENALSVYEKSLALDDSNAQTWRDKGNILVKQGDILTKQEKLQNARGVYKEVIKEKLQEARAAYEEAISRMPNDAFSYIDNAEVLFKLELYSEAVLAYNKAITSYNEAVKRKEVIRRDETIRSWYRARGDTKMKIAEKLHKEYERLQADAEDDYRESRLMKRPI